MLREPDPQGSDYWVRRLKQGTALRDVVKAFFWSNEYKKKPVRQRITSLYKVILSRNPDIGGLNFYKKELSSSRKSLHVIAADFVWSAEFKKKSRLHREYIKNTLGIPWILK